MITNYRQRRTQSQRKIVSQVDDDGVLRAQLRLSEKQKEFVSLGDDPTCRHSAFVTGLGRGKTYAGAGRSLIKAARNINNKSRGLIAANTYKQLTNATLVEFFKLLEDKGIGYHHHKGDSTVTLYFDGDHTYTIYVTSLENYQVIRGWELGWAWLDEIRDTPEDAFKVIIGRIRDKRCDKNETFSTTTPRGFDWIYRRFVKNRKPNVRLVQGISNEYWLPSDYLEDLHDQYDERMAKQEIYGEFLNITANQAYYMFTRGDHVNDGIKYNPHMPILASFDFNRRPMSLMLMQEYNRVLTCVFDEIVINDSYTEETCAEFIKRFPKHRGGLEIYGDPSGKWGTTASRKSDYSIIEEMFGVHGHNYPNFSVNVRIKAPSHHDRLNVANGRLKNSRGLVRVQIHPKCKNLIEDLEQTTVKEGTVDQIEKKDDERTHASDAFSYCLERRFPIKKFDEWSQ